jgi:hypothetical protein
MRALCVASLVAILTLAPAADAQQIDLISGGDGTFPADFAGASGNGSRVVFATEEPLGDSDTDTAFDVYAREPDGALTHLSDGPNAADPDEAATFAGISSDGTRVFFSTRERLSGTDTDVADDVYESGPDGLRHLSDDPTGPDDDESAVLEAASVDGARAFFGTAESLTPEDTDTELDVYERTAAGDLRLVSDDDAPGMDPDLPASLAGISEDGSRVFLQTDESFAAADTDVAADIYERGPGGLRLLSDGIGLDADVPVSFARASADGTHVFLETLERLALTDEDDSRDVYESTSSEALVHVSDGPDADAELPASLATVSSDGARAFLQTRERLTAGDSDDATDLYERGPGGLRLVSDGPVEPDASEEAFIDGISSDGTRVFFATAEPLLPDDADAAEDVYERTPSGALALVSDDAGALDASLNAFFEHVDRNGVRVTFRTAESLAAGDTDAAPDLYQRTPTGAVVHLTDGAADPDAMFDASFAGASSDGTRVFFETGEGLVDDDIDDSRDLYAATLPPVLPPEGPRPQPPIGDGPPPEGGPVPDTTRPALSRVRLARRRFARRTELRFTLSEPATVRLRIERALPGRRVGRSCRAPSRRNRGRRCCTRYRVAARRTVRARAGANAVPLRAGHLGAYRLTITAVDAAGNVSRRARLRFTVVRPRSR